MRCSPVGGEAVAVKALLATTLLFSAACGTAVSSGAATSPSASAQPSATAYAKPSAAPSATDRLPLDVRVLATVPGRAMASPDGKWIAATEPAPSADAPAVSIYDIAGKRVARFTAWSWSWLPDSSGLYVGLDAPQRAPDLFVAELDGTLTRTGLQFAHPLLSRDRAWIVAEHQEGCCAAVEIKEIWVAPRHGGTPHVLARTRTTSLQPIALLGIDANDRVIYRDSGAIMRVALTGGTAETLASGGEYATTIMGDTTPSGFAMLIRGYDPARWYVVWNDAVFAWNDAWGTILLDGQSPSKLSGPRPLWYDANTLVVTMGTRLGLRQVGEANAAALGTDIENGDKPLAIAQRRLLLARGPHAIVLDLETGRAGDTGIDLGPDTMSTFASPLPSGSFIVSTGYATYRVD